MARKISKFLASDAPLWLVEFHTLLWIQTEDKINLEINKRKRSTSDLNVQNFKVFSSEYLEKEGLVLLLEWESEPVDDGSQDLQQLSNTVVSLSLVDKAVEDIVDLFPEK